MKIFLVDGSGFLFRAYYGLPPLTGRDGHNMNVAFGFFRMMFKLAQHKPDVLLITRDSPVKTKRHEISADYKGTRKEQPEDFIRQIPLTQELVKQLGIAAIVQPGYEADDIIATCAQQRKKDSSNQITIVSSDKDLKQLIDENVVCMDAMKDEVTDSKKFLEQYGFEPKYMIDYLCMIGDSSDNIKGVAGIGPKKATSLIQQYGTIENIYAHIQELSADVKEKLETSKEVLDMAQSLVSLQAVPDVQNDMPGKYTFNPDFHMYERVLVQEHGFASMKKIIDELKKVYVAPTQNSLFG